MISRRRFVSGVSAAAISLGLPAASIQEAEARFPLGTGSGAPIYAQGMGATDASGLVVSFPLSPSALLPQTTFSASGSITNNQYTIGSIFAGRIAVGQTLFSTTGVKYGQVLSLVSGSGQTGGSVWQLDTTTGGATLTGLSITAQVGARQWFCDAVNGIPPSTNPTMYNGLSPYPGYQMNGSGDSFQYGATGRGTANSTYGPLPTLLAAYSQIVAASFRASANQIFLAQAQTFFEGGAKFNFTANGTTTITVNSVAYGYIEAGLYLLQGIITGSPQIKSQVFPLNGGETVGGLGRYILSITQAANTGNCIGVSTNNGLGSGLNQHFGESVAYPQCVQSYDNTGVLTGAANALNVATQGRATGSNRPTVLCDPVPATFLASTSGSSTSVSIAAGSLLGQVVNKTGQYLTASGVPANVYTIAASVTTSGFTTNIPVNLPASTSCTLSNGGYGLSQLFGYGQTLNPQTNGVVAGNWVFRGLNYTGSNTFGNGLNIAAGNPYNVLIENCTLPNTGVGIGGVGAGSTIGFTNAKNVIIRRCGISNNAINAGGHGASGIGFGDADQVFVEDCVVWRGGWYPDTNDRQAAYAASATLSSSTLTINSGLTGTVAIGQQFVLAGGTIGYIVSGSGSTWQTTVTGSTSGPCVFSTGLYGPTIYDHGLYGAIGANDQPTVRRNTFVDCSATGYSSRASAICYNNVFIDNPVATFAGGAENSSATTVANFTANVSGTLLTVTAFNATTTQPTPFFGIYPGQNCTLISAGNITGSPYVVSQVLPLLPGEALNQIGRYNLSVSQSTFTGIACSTSSPGYSGQSPAGSNFYFHDNLVMGANDITAGSFGYRHSGIGQNQNGNVGSSIARNLLVNNDQYGIGNTTVGGSVFAFSQIATYDISNWTDLSFNAAYGYSTILEANNTAPYPTQLLTTYGNTVITVLSAVSYNATTGVLSMTTAAATGVSVGSNVIVNISANGVNYPSVQNKSYAVTAVSGNNVQVNVGTGLDITPTGGTISVSTSPGTNTVSTSSVTNAQIYAALQALGYGDGTRNGLAAQMVASPELNWAYIIMQTAGPMFNNFPFQYA